MKLADQSRSRADTGGTNALRPILLRLITQSVLCSNLSSFQTMRESRPVRANYKKLNTNTIFDQTECFSHAAVLPQSWRLMTLHHSRRVFSDQVRLHTVSTTGTTSMVTKLESSQSPHLFTGRSIKLKPRRSLHRFGCDSTVQQSLEYSEFLNECKEEDEDNLRVWSFISKSLRGETNVNKSKLYFVHRSALFQLIWSALLIQQF